MSVVVYLLNTLPASLTARVAPGATEAVFILTLPITLFWIGYVGAERLWYRRVREGTAFGIGDAWRSAWLYLGRFWRLGFVVSIPLIVFETANIVANAGTPRYSSTYLVASVVWLIAFDVLATFVTPALAYTTSSTRRALRIGVSMLGSAWPADAPYVLVPAFTFVFVTRLLPVGTSIAALVVVGVASTLIDLLAKGAIAALYVRHEPAADADAIPQYQLAATTARHDWVP